MRIFFIFFTLLLSACSSQNDAGAAYQTRFDFSQVKTYSLYERNSESREFQSINNIIRNGIEIAIERSMDRQGFLYSELDEADLIVSYHLVGRRAKDYTHYNRAVLYCEHCLRANTWQTEQKNWTISAGSLILDLVDPKTKRSVWRGVSSLDIKEKDNSREANEKIVMAVNAMLALYPNA
jgi:hypothetical protein